MDLWAQLLALIVSLVAAWIVFRLQRREEREGVLSALVAELQLHDDWVGGNGWPPGRWDQDVGKVWWSTSPDWNVVVFKLSTVATEHAIVVGPTLFINRGLVRALVVYRQKAHQFNQTIDDFAAFGANADLWMSTERQAQLREQRDVLAKLIHEGGIGDNRSNGANQHFQALRRSLRAERDVARWRWWLWFLLGKSRGANDEPKPTW